MRLRTSSTPLVLPCLLLTLLMILPVVPTIPSGAESLAPVTVLGPPTGPSMRADYPYNYTHVVWEQGTRSESYSDSYAFQDWQFGPAIRWQIKNATTGASITVMDTLVIDGWFDLEVQTPKASLRGQLPYAVGVMGTYFNVTEMATGEFSSNTIAMIAVYIVPQNRWEFYSSWNATWAEPIESGGFKESPVEATDLPPDWSFEDEFGPAVNPFLEQDKTASQYYIGPDDVWTSFRFKLNESSPRGVFSFGAMALDSNLNPLAESIATEESARTVGMTLHEVLAEATGGYYELSRLDDDGNTVYSATRGVDFNVTLRIGGFNLDNATVFFELPWQVLREELVEGPYQEHIQRTGGWVFDVSAGTYVWNASLVVDTVEVRYGLHWETHPVYIDSGTTYSVWDDDLGQYVDVWTPGYVALVYWFENNSFSTMYGYMVDGYKWVVEGLDAHPNLPLSFILNTTSSIHYYADGHDYVVFRGHVSEDMLPTGGASWQAMHMDVQVLTEDDKRLIPFASLPFADESDIAMDQMLRVLAVESPVSVVELTRKEEEYRSNWLFAVDRGDTFTVRARLQGGADVAGEIDGVAFVLSSYEHEWGTDAFGDWSQEESVELWIRASPAGQFEVKTYNTTRRVSYEYGTYWEWQYIEVFDGFWDWQLVEITGYGWHEKWWNFTSGTWTDIPLYRFAPETVMPVTFAEAGNLTYELVGNDLRVAFDVTVTQSMPETSWDWQFFYGDLQMVIDYESGWGYHELLGWKYDLVYSYQDGPDRLYAERPYRGHTMRNNDTDELYHADWSAYISIGGTNHTVRKFVEQYPDGLVYERFIYEEWDPTAYDPWTGGYTGNWVRYYVLDNGTRIDVLEGHESEIYNITVQSGEWFLALHDAPWGVPYMPGLQRLMLANGTVLIEPDAYWAGFGATPLGTVPVAKIGRYSLLNASISVYWAVDPVWMGDHYTFYVNGTNAPVDVWYGYAPDIDFEGYFYFNSTDGSTYWFLDGLWPVDIYRGEHGGKAVIAPEALAYYFAYTDIRGVKDELPYPGAVLYGPEDLEYVTPVALQVHINGHYRPTWQAGSYHYFNATEGLDYWYQFYHADVEGVIYNLTLFGLNPNSPWSPTYEWDFPWVTTGNGTQHFPSLDFAGWRLAYGHRDAQTYEFVIDGFLELTSGYYDDTYSADFLVYNGSSGHYEARTRDGWVLALNDTTGELTSVRGYFYNLTFTNGTSVYTSYPYVNAYEVYDPVRGMYDLEWLYTWDLDGDVVSWSLEDTYTTRIVQVTIIDIGSVYYFEVEGVLRECQSYMLVSRWDFSGQSWIEFNIPSPNLEYPTLLYDVTNSSVVYEVMPMYANEMTEVNYTYHIPVFHAGPTNFTGNWEMIHRLFTFWGYGMKMDYVPLPVTVIRSQWTIVVGVPKFGLWGIQSWAIDLSTGALDLDGDLGTTDDQYYVLHSYESTDTYRVDEEYLRVHIKWEPNSTVSGDEVYVDSYTGLRTVNWSYDWADNFYWRRADTGEPLTPAEWTQVTDTIYDSQGMPRPGYWDIAFLSRNFTSDDLRQQAAEEGWDWAASESQEWSWIWWELSEHYVTELPNATAVSVTVSYQYAGAFAWNDTNRNNYTDIDPMNIESSEVTHYWLPVSVDDVSFITPNGSLSGDIMWSLDAAVPFGVTFTNVTGAAFPFGDRSYWDWYAQQQTGSNFATFDERPTLTEVSSFGIGVSFTGEVSEPDNTASVKFNMTVGDWMVDAPGGRSLLTNRSLGLAFFTDVELYSETGEPILPQYTDDLGNPLFNNETVASENFTLSTGLSSYGSMNMGDSPYVWSKNRSATYTRVNSQTVPLSVFEAAYISDSGITATSFDISSSQFYTLVNFKWWDGYAVSVDPVFISYVSGQGVTDNTAPSISNVETEVLFVNGKERLYYTVTVTDTGGSGLASVRIVNLDDLGSNVSLTYRGDIQAWVGYVEMQGTTPYTFNSTIAAVDYASNEATSDEIHHTFYNDPTPPEISNVGSQSIGPQQSYVLISATVIDVGASGTDHVDIYLVNTEQTVSMSYNASIDKWQAYVARTSGSAYTLAYRVLAYDRAGNLKQSSQFTYAFKDAIAPSVSAVSAVTVYPAGQEALYVSASVGDTGGSGLASVQLTYTISGNPTTVAMSYNASTARYQHTVPNQAPGTYVFYTITATDNAGNSFTTTERVYRFSTSGDTPPGIGSLNLNPQEPSSSQAVNVSVTILDEGSILNATLYYRVNGGPYTGLAMTHTGDVYSAVIPAQPHGSIVECYVVAFDNLEQRSESSVTSYTVNDDVTAPVITGLSIDKSTVTSADSVVVSATITDDVAVKNATLYYKVGTGSWIAVVMTHVGDVYSATIPPQADGSVVTYYVRAYDTSDRHSDSAEQSYTVQDATGTTTTSPVSPLPEMTIIVVLGGAGAAVVAILLVLRLRKKN
ncbi:MAG: hypothetical protein HXY34_05440 [Candidatus Thorarchaeota archaeon]|nr:hypothetical protein [Candidatus Thorarchaeota archaeon]